MKKGKTTTQDFIEMMEFEAQRNETPYGATLSNPEIPKSESKQHSLPKVKAIETDNKLTTKRVQTDNKLATNRQQSDNSEDIELTTKWQQGGNGKNETGNKVATEPATLSATNRQQTGNKPTTKLSFSALVGLQRSLVIFLYESCKVSRSRSTDSLTLEHVASIVQTGSGSVKTTLQRLEKKGYINRIDFKNGRSGWSKYELPEIVYSELLRLETGNKLTTNWQQTGNKVGTEPATEPATRALGSIGSINILNTKLTNSDSSWETLNLSSADKYGIHAGTLMRIRQLCPELQSDEVSVVADKFSKFMALQNRMKVDNPVAFFISLCQKAARGENVFPEIETDNDRVMKMFIEKSKLESEKRQKVDEEVLEIAFQEWMGSMTHSSRIEVVPGLKMLREGSEPYTKTCKSFYRSNLWLERKQELLNELKEKN